MTRWLFSTTLLGLALIGCTGEDTVDDQDGDGFTTDEGDCDDLDSLSNPVAVEICDGLDNDCDTRIDEGLDAVGVVAWYLDADADG
jgi:hypothetical protein